jgi:ferredoxin-fold anticodon binding domain-containing protein
LPSLGRLFIFYNIYTSMKLEQLRALIKEEFKKTLNEEYQDKYKMVGMLFTNIKKRPQKEIFSDLRSLPGVTVASVKEPMEYSEQNTEKFQSILTVKVDGYPWISKGGFDKSKMEDIRREILKIDGVLAFNVNPDNITAM